MPEAFEFTVKAWQLITHRASSPTYRRTKRTLSAAEREGCGFFADTPITREAHARTIACARVLRATAVLFQCPASFAPTDENCDRMRRYFRRRTHAPPELEGGSRLRYLWEPRGPRWVAARERAIALADELGLVLVVDPFVTRPEPGRPVYFRLHGIGGAAHSYSEAELTHLASMLDVAPGVERSTPAYVLFNNLPRVGDATRFLARVRRDRAC